MHTLQHALITLIGERDTTTPLRKLVLHFVRDLVLVLLMMVILAGLLTLLTNTNFLFEFYYCLAIGISIHTIHYLLCIWSGVRITNLVISLVAILSGTILGITIGTLANRIPLASLFVQRPMLISMLLLSLICGASISYFFYSTAALAKTTAALRQEELDRISRERALSEANLRLLQAQIEPHFLFNTLSNVIAMIRDTPDQAERMLTNFTDYLRASLRQNRADRITLRDELATVRSYLEIMQIRMGGRLQFHIDTTPELLDTMLPPLLIQPLVENAIIHGIEPLPQGGTVLLTISCTDQCLMIEITDTGCGIDISAPQGVGMGTVVERLRLAYGETAHLRIRPNSSQGTRIQLTLPKEQCSHA